MLMKRTLYYVAIAILLHTCDEKRKADPVLATASRTTWSHVQMGSICHVFNCLL